MQNRWRIGDKIIVVYLLILKKEVSLQKYLLKNHER